VKALRYFFCIVLSAHRVLLTAASAAAAEPVLTIFTVWIGRRIHAILVVTITPRSAPSASCARLFLSYESPSFVSRSLRPGLHVPERARGRRALRSAQRTSVADSSHVCLAAFLRDISAAAPSPLLAGHESVMEEAGRGSRPGICNGFQILCEAHLLPARSSAIALSLRLRHIYVRVENNLTASRRARRRIRSSASHRHGEGNTSPTKHPRRAQQNRQIVLRLRRQGLHRSLHPNGSPKTSPASSPAGNVFASCRSQARRDAASAASMAC